MKPIVKHIHFFIFLLLFLYAKGQESNIVFQSLPQGLPENTITSITQDEFGFLWIGTRYGLNRFDGVEYITYESSLQDSTGLRCNMIECLLSDKKGNIWVGTYGGGLNVLDLHSNEFRRISLGKNNPEIDDDYITALFMDENDIIWIGTEKDGLFVYDPETQNYQRYFYNVEKPDDVSLQYITAISTDKQGNIWVGTFGEGIAKIERGSGRVQMFQYSEATNGIANNEVRCLHKGTSGRLWVGTNNGIQEIISDEEVQFNKVFSYSDTGSKYAQKTIDDLNTSAVLAIHETEQTLMISVENQGLACVDSKSKALDIYKNSPFVEESIISNSIWSIYEDRDGIIWIGSFLRGICKIDPLQDKFRNVYQVNIDENYHPLEIISSISQDEEGNLWISSDGGGLIFQSTDGSKNTYYSKNGAHPISNNDITSTLIDREGNVWIGTWNGGINIKYRGRSQFEPFKIPITSEDQVSMDLIYDLFEDSKGRIWISTFRAGIKVYDPKTKSFSTFNRRSKNRRIVSNKIRAIAEDAQGNIWLGPEETGLEKLRLNENLEIAHSTFFGLRPSKNDVDGIRINDIFLDSENQLWVATSGNGLFRINPESNATKRYSRNDGLPTNLIHGLQEDNKKVLWVSTNADIFGLDLKTDKIIRYSSEDGLQEGGFYKSAALKSKDGHILFGGTNGYTIFNPDNIQTNFKIPPVYITQVNISNKRYPWKSTSESKNLFNNQQITLNHRDNDLSFEFAALNFIQSGKNKYVYILENYEEQWRTSGLERLAYYANVPPGKYTFKVRASNNDNIWNNEGASINIHIKKPWFNTYLAYFIYVIIFASLLLWARHNIIMREKLSRELELEHLQLEKAQEINQIKNQFFTNITHEFKTPLTLIMSPLQTLLSKAQIQRDDKAMLSLIRRNAQRLNQLINQLLDMSMADAGYLKLKTSEQDVCDFVRNITFEFIAYAEEELKSFNLYIPEQKILCYFEADKLEKVIVNLLSNAFKFTPKKGSIDVTIRESKGKVLIDIKNTGIGIPKDEQEKIFDRYYKSGKNTNTNSTGIGLALCKQFMDMHKGSIEVESIPNQHTTFTVGLLKGKHHLNASEIIERPNTLSTDIHPSISTITEKIETVGIEDEQKDLPEEIYEKDLILVIEDNQEMQSYIKNILNVQYDVITANNGREGEILAQKYIPNLIITDILMPEVDGYELVKRIKSNEITSHIFTVMMSVNASDQSQSRGFHRGIDAYLAKPFNPDLLKLRVKNLLATRSEYKRQLLEVKNVQVDPQKLSYKMSEKDEKLMKSITQVIDENLSRIDFKIDDMCKSLGMSKSQLYRKLKGLFGISGNEMIRTMRIKKAALYLQQTDMRISEITYEVGLNDLQYFRNNFKKHYGMSPSKYRDKFNIKRPSEETNEHTV